MEGLFEQRGHLEGIAAVIARPGDDEDRSRLLRHYRYRTPSGGLASAFHQRGTWRRALRGGLDFTDFRAEVDRRVRHSGNDSPRAYAAPARPATCCASGSDEVRPGDSMP